MDTEQCIHNLYPERVQQLTVYIQPFYTTIAQYKIQHSVNFYLFVPKFLTQHLLQNKRAVHFYFPIYHGI